METFERSYPEFSACGLNCGLCPRYHTNGPSRCPGCSGEKFFTKRPACGIISCCIKHGGIEYCYLCGEYPCEKYKDADKYDSFITHQNMISNFERIKSEGIESYKAELDEKISILRELLDHYNDGRKKSFFCLAVGLLSLKDIQTVMTDLRARTYDDDPVKEKAATAVKLFQEMADLCGIKLKLFKK